MSNVNLFSDFNPVSAKEWKQKIQFELKGADYNEILVWESPEGIKVKPFYHSDDAIGTRTNNKNTSGWSIGQHIYAGNADAANKKAKSVLQRGVESLQFSIPSKAVKICGILDGINIDKIPVYLELQFLSSEYTKSIIDHMGGGKKNGYLNIDVIGHLARTGNWFFNRDKDFGILDGLLDYGHENVLCVNATLYQNSGANIVQQLAYALAHANEYLNAFAHKGKIGIIQFKVAIGTNYFFEIAKLRALRSLWEILATEYGVSKDCHIIAVPTKRNKTLYDHNMNMLRTTTECMSAILGGSNMVCNMPYDAVYHKDNAFGERISLNQLLLLKNESYFDKVNNAADGAYYIEALTQQLAQKALELFKTIEAGGGFLKQLKNHVIQRKIKESALKEQNKFNMGQEVLVGTNKYQNESDKMKDIIELYPFVKKNARKTLLTPVIERRLAEEIEQMRLKDE
ncbi:methylmalonyl-CoA mutase subunit beta [Maribacter sp. 2304DJ31-5]|uniref:methylmalonyl-CoA mutase subunit beta n=1 Tax=Maribacter sp. 2304DJ31-5 TaxID=3386273 RepID=UPI0039BC721D